MYRRCSVHCYSATNIERWTWTNAEICWPKDRNSANICTIISILLWMNKLTTEIKKGKYVYVLGHKYSMIWVWSQEAACFCASKTLVYEILFLWLRNGVTLRSLPANEFVCWLSHSYSLNLPFPHQPCHFPLVLFPQLLCQFSLMQP